MALVGTLEDRHLTKIPARKNQRDKSTIISIFPQQIIEDKITIFPSRYVIPYGTMAKPGALTIGPASWWKDIPESSQLIEVVEDSETVANAIINDWSIGLFGYNALARPGLFFLTEEISAADALKKYPEKFEEANQKQKNWFLWLVNTADQFWARTPNPLAISGLMRLAARELGMETKDWLQNYQTAKMEKCPACGSPRDTNFPVCGTCNMIVDKKLAEERGILLKEK